MSVTGWKKRLLWGGILLCALTVGAVGWATFGADESCSHPACARQRFSLFLEVDSFRSVAPVALEVVEKGETITIESILKSGGVDLLVEHDQLALPYAAASGPLDRADLEQYSRIWRSRPRPEGVDASLYAMVAPALVSDAGERLFGIMFDSVGREAFAIAPGETVRLFADRHEDSIALLQLRTFTHELLHALNRRHLDAVQMRDGRLTLEAPTRCIAAVHRDQWTLVEPPLMSISPTTIRFFQTAQPWEVLPGVANTPYQQPRTSATECEDVRQASRAAPASTQWDRVRRRLMRLLFLQSAHAQDAEGDAGDDSQAGDAQAGSPSVELRLQAQPAQYPFGYPVAVRLMAMNTGDTALPLRGRLSPAFGMIQIEYRETPEATEEVEEDSGEEIELEQPESGAEADAEAEEARVRAVEAAEEAADEGADQDGWRAIKPLAWYEPASNQNAALEPGEHTEQTAPIYFGESGWTFPEPGDYEVRARLLMSEEEAAAISNIVSVRVAEPVAADDQAALAPLLDENGELDPRVGRLLTLGGRIGVDADIPSIAAVAERYGHTSLGSALRLTLVSQQLNPPIDPRTGERPRPDLDQARELLKNTCNDSGVAALKDQLLERYSDAAPAEMTSDANSNAAAWDGVNEQGEAIATYSDPELHAIGPSLHFCHGQEQLSGRVQAAAKALAQQVRQSNPSRVIVVGHADMEANCRYNDALALRRADQVKRLMIDAGVPADAVHTASLGKRRPLDFAANPAARRLNRRVEVLIDAAEPRESPHEELQRVLPTCSLNTALR